MGEISIVAVRPKAISAKDKKTLATAGIVVIEMDEPETLRFLKPNAELDGNDLLLAALGAMKKHPSIIINEAFVRLMHEALTTHKGQTE